MSFGLELKDILLPVGTTLGCAALFLLIRALLLRGVGKTTLSPVAKVEEVIGRVLKRPSLFWCYAFAVRAGVEASRLPEHFRIPINVGIKITILFSATLAAANLLEALVQHALAKAGSLISETGFIRGAARMVAFVIGFLLILANLGVHLGPFLTALGVGGLALGLALQDTLANFFAGLGLLLDRKILIGDQIKLESGQEGQVKDIGWRSTKIRMSASEELIIPNSKLAQTINIRKFPG